MTLQLIKPLEKDYSPKIRLMLAKMYAADEKASHVDYFLNLFKENSLRGYDALSLLNTFTIYMSKQSISIQLNALEVYKTQNLKGNYYAKMYLPENVYYLIQSIETNSGSQSSIDKIMIDKYLKELKSFYDTIKKEQ